MFKKIFVILAALFIGIFISTQTAYAVFEKANISALDTIVNFGTLLKADGVEPGLKVDFLIKKPDGTKESLRAFADNSGQASAEVVSEQTRIAGIYEVFADKLNLSSSFQVFPGDLSVSSSGVYASKSFVSANGVDYALINVRATDEFGNPLQFHEVKLNSSRISDSIFSKSSETDEKGLISFLVSSREAGSAVFTATDESVGETFTIKPKITFLSAPYVYKSVGGDPETVLLAQAPLSGVAKLIIENIPATANMNETISFTVKAADLNGNTVSSYSGTVVFSSTDPNAKVPGPYSFKLNDQGVKTFDLGLNFSTQGSQTLTVQEQGNAVIKGTKTVEVLAGLSGSAGQVKITKPGTGTYSVNTMEIRVEAAPNAKVKIFDNGQQMAEVQTGADGSVSFNTPLLTDGEHTFHAESSGVQSSSVKVTIDSTPAQVEQFEIGKLELAPGESTTISVHSDPNLTAIQATIGESIIDLASDPKNPGVYSGVITAPAQTGVYTMNVIITDAVGNVSPPQELDKKITVLSGLTSGATSFSVPSKIKTVQAIAGPGSGKITLSWSSAQAESGIAFYRIYYGTNSANLNLVVNTKDSNTTWYIPSLQNGIQYFFQVVGIDKNGQEGDNRSDMISASPQADAGGVGAAVGATLPLVSGGDTGPVLCDPMPCPPDLPYAPQTPDDGPEIFGILAVALAGGGIWKFFKRR
ncbi:Ig-like domain-containing protein [Candidatus Peregrinibacteria bacterium]|nr:Ig-like domain-containing protein [Candidatus Peregrinibacteria bacterium]